MLLGSKTFEKMQFDTPLPSLKDEDEFNSIKNITPSNKYDSLKWENVDFDRFIFLSAVGALRNDKCISYSLDIATLLSVLNVFSFLRLHSLKMTLVDYRLKKSI